MVISSKLFKNTLCKIWTQFNKIFNSQPFFQFAWNYNSHGRNFKNNVQSKFFNYFENKNFSKILKKLILYTPYREQGILIRKF